MSKRTTRTESSEASTPAPRKRKAAAAAEPVAAAPKAPAPRLRKKPVESAASSAPSNGHSATEIVVSDVATIDNGGPSYEQIATRAYFIALERGFQTDPLSDWLVAERELRSSARS